MPINLAHGVRLQKTYNLRYHRKVERLPELIGKMIGQYHLIAEINETGNVIVYKGIQPAANRYVAVKILKPGAAHSPEAVERYQQEGDLLAQFHHPRLLEVYETGEAEGLVFRAARLAENGSLQDHLVFGSHNLFHEISRVILLFEEIVEGLEFIHAQGYIHGNLKPTKILLDAILHPLLGDFGLPARIGDGTSPYLAPEQLQGGVVDQRADVFALGVLLFTTLIGAAPQAGVMVSPRSGRPDLPEGVESVVLKAMAHNPDQRFQSAAEFFNALQMAFIPSMPRPVFTPAPGAPLPEDS
jgi:eukaryotic-like serine/threonine-protein kinase